MALSSILMLVGAVAHAGAIQPEGLSALKELRIAEGDAGVQRLLITDRSGAVVLDTDKALPRIENEYSPHSYDGYMAELLAERQGKSTVIDLQGERHTLLSPVNKAGDYLLLTTREEGNGAYNFNLKFRYDGTTKSFELPQILLNENDTQCDQSLLSSYAIDSKALGATLIADFDGSHAFGALRALRLAHQRSSAVTAEKLMPEAVASNFDAALKTYKAGNAQTENPRRLLPLRRRRRCLRPRQLHRREILLPAKGRLVERSGLFVRVGRPLPGGGGAAEAHHPQAPGQGRRLPQSGGCLLGVGRAQAREAYGQYQEK